MTQAQLRNLRYLTVEQLLAAFKNGGYTYERAELRGTTFGEDRCHRLGHLEKRVGQLVFDFRFQDEDGRWVNGLTFVTLDAAGRLVAEH